MFRYFCLLLNVHIVYSQVFQPSQQPGQYNIHDPIRRALGIWGHLLNRMSQPYQSTTDEQLHLRDKEDRPIFDVESLPSLFPMLSPKPRGSGSIIDEMRLNQLLPRFREEPTTSTIATSASTTTTLSTTTTPKPMTTTSTKKPTSQKTTTVKVSTSTAIQDDEKKPTKTTKRSELKATVRVVEDKKKSTKELKDDSTDDTEKKVTTTKKPSIKSSTSKTTTTRTSTSKSATTIETAAVKATKSPSKAKPTIKPHKTTTTAPASESESFEGSGEDDSEELQSAESMQNEDSENSSLENDHMLPISTTTSKKSTKSTTISTTTGTTTPEPKSTTTTKKLKSKSKGHNVNIPEGEEEEATEFQSDERPFSTTTAPEKATTSLSVMANFYENSMKVEKLMHPVSSIIDGIGPLILPLLGYSRQAVSAAAPIAVAARPVVAGVRTFKPQQIQSNSEIPSNTNIRSTQQHRLQKAYGGPKASIIKQSSRPPLPDPIASAQSSAFITKTDSQTPSVESLAQSQTAFVVPNAAAYQNLVETENSRLTSETQQIERDTRTALIRQLLARQGISDSRISNSQMPQQMTQEKKEFVGISPASRTSQSSATATGNDQDPGYQRGRNMVNTFYEDSGLMLQSEPSTIPTSAPTSGGGFGAGRKPNQSFEQALTLSDENPFSFI